MTHGPTPSGELDTASLFASRQVARARAWNRLLDGGATGLIAVGGLGVIGAVLLIALYLVYEVLPLFEPARIEQSAGYGLPRVGVGPSLFLGIDEQGQVAMRISEQGRVIFFDLADGAERAVVDLPLGSGVRVVSIGADPVQPGLLALGLSDGSALLVRQRYRSEYPGGVRVVTPGIEYPYGAVPQRIFDQRTPITSIAVDEGEDELLLLAQSAQGSRGHFIGAQPASFDLPIKEAVSRFLIAPDHQRIIVLDGLGDIAVLLRNGKAFGLGDVQWESPRPLADIAWLAGGQSLVALERGGGISQWFFLQQANGGDGGQKLVPVQRFAAGTKPQVHLVAEQGRKGFLAVDEGGSARLFHATAGRELAVQALGNPELAMIALSPRADRMLVETRDGRLLQWAISNPHPEVSLHTLWGEVWYEGYEEPAYRWQSTAADGDFEAKLSLVPLVFGTLKAAFYAMLIATPLALAGAVFTAYFMAPAMRERVKPLVELMEALPTVILGFLAGLWLAPLLERHMISVLLGLLMLPVVTLGVAFAWYCLPAQLSARVPSGWQAALLLPVIALTVWVCYLAAPGVEASAFGGDFVGWLTADLGVAFDQRNALVVGIAMGFAVVPTIFSIAEDALFSVPRHLTMGSLALGAQPWQTLVGVVLPTASPGIFSAVMIGFGRAVGETMIVLMATGNTPIMDFNIFEGMRTLAANLAVEVPEAAVDSTHYRVLFLAGLVLFAFTFFVNTAAELLRQRLRSKYGSL